MSGSVALPHATRTTARAEGQDAGAEAPANSQIVHGAGRRSRAGSGSGAGGLRSRRACRRAAGARPPRRRCSGVLGEQVADLVGPGQEHQLGERVDVEVEVEPSGRSTPCSARSTVSSASGSRRDAARTAGRGRSGRRRSAAAPFLRRCCWKMSAKLVDRIARTPHAASAHGACSRDEPAPKLSPASRIWRPGHLGLVEDERRVLERAVLLEPPVAEQRVGEAGLVGHLEVAGRDDLVGVDVLGRQRDDLAA